MPPTSPSLPNPMGVSVSWLGSSTTSCPGDAQDKAGQVEWVSRREAVGQGRPLGPQVSHSAFPGQQLITQGCAGARGGLGV